MEGVEAAAAAAEQCDVLLPISTEDDEGGKINWTKKIIDDYLFIDQSNPTGNTWPNRFQLVNNKGKINDKIFLQSTSEITEEILLQELLQKY